MRGSAMARYTYPRSEIDVDEASARAQALIAQERNRTKLERLWRMYLDEPDTDVVMRVDNVMSLLEDCCMLDGPYLTGEMMRNYLEAVTAGRTDAVLVAKVPRDKNAGGLSRTHFMAMVQWIAVALRISYAECLARLVDGGGKTSTLRVLSTIFHRFGNVSTPGEISMFEFFRFCKAFDLVASGEFTMGDVYLLFMKYGTAHTVDFDGFLCLLALYADRVGMELKMLFHTLVAKS